MFGGMIHEKVYLSLGSGTYALALDGPTGGGNGICLYPFGGYYKADLGKNTFR